jgi:hypothetical protein
MTDAPSKQTRFQPTTHLSVDHWEDPQCADMLRATYGALCCAPNYVALGRLWAPFARDRARHRHDEPSTWLLACVGETRRRGALGRLGLPLRRHANRAVSGPASKRRPDSSTRGAADRRAALVAANSKWCRADRGPPIHFVGDQRCPLPWRGGRTRRAKPRPRQAQQLARADLAHPGGPVGAR